MRGRDGRRDGEGGRGGGTNRGIYRRNKACMHVRTISTVDCMVIANR